MNYTYKQFNIDNATYIFCVEDFEIFKILHDENVESVLQKIKTKKEKSNLQKDKNKMENLKYDITNSKNINLIGLEIANGCTLNCTYCYISARNKPRKTMREEKFLDILNFLKNVNDNNITFYFTGAGEPTLNFNLLKKIPYLCKKNGFDKCDFDLTTNGTILTKEMVEFFKLNEFTISVSVDGNENIHDASRIYHNGKGSFKDVFHNMNLLKENNIKFACKTVVLPDNKNLVETFLFFEENKIHFNFAIATSSIDNNFSPNIEDLNTFEEQMDSVIKEYRKLIEDNHKIYAVKIINDLKRIHYGAINKIACSATINGYFVDIDGGIFTCSYHSGSEDVSIGNIYTGIDYEKIIKNSYYAKPVDDYPTCKVCWMKHLCAGSCFARKWLEHKNTDDPSQYLCKTYNIYWNAIIKLYIQLHPVIISGDNVNFKSNDKKT
jgi:radical SAM protein with 4Fe4S-binding SPASM domain